jgi:hypothetical protein
MSEHMKNARELPTVWYGKHMSAGVAEYREPNKDPYRILVNEDTIRRMDASFPGRPVYVRHVDEVNLDKIQVEADGYVVESFYNKADSSHWCKFIIVSDKGREAIRLGYKLSNAYIPKSFGPAGISKGVEYQKEVTSAEYEHLALVNDPRYEDSIILAPKDFLHYNNERIMSLDKVANSKEKPSMLKFFKRTDTETSDISDTIVKLKNGKEVTVAQLINSAEQEKEEKKEVEHKKENSPAEEDMDKTPSASHKETPAEEKKHGREDEGEKEHEAPAMANMDHHVTVGNGTMSVKDLMREHKEMKDCMNTMMKHGMKNDEQMDGGEKDAEKEAQPADLTKRNADLDGGEKEATSQEAKADKTKRNSKFFDDLKDAPNRVFDFEAPIDLDKAARGKARYGSGN